MHQFQIDSNREKKSSPKTPLSIPESLESNYRGNISTQQALGRLLTALGRIPEVSARMVTTSPDVAISTNLGGWINKMRVYYPE